jgi:3-oxoacyl-[acyl-carrier-protein] synthase-3
LPLQVLILKQSTTLFFAHNFGDVKAGTTQSDMLPSLATRVKKITNKTLNVFFGPGWIKCASNAFIKSGM